MMRNRLSSTAAIAALLFCTASACVTTSFSASPQSEVSGPVDELLAKMTLEEKIGQMTLFSANWAATGNVNRETYRSDIAAGRVGAIFSAYTAAETRELQRIAVEESRLGIPLLFGFDVIHGHRTIFPMPLAEAASWDLAAIEKSARIAATEAAAEGLHWTFAPMVDVARDPRWGRVAEGAGEDVYLASQIAGTRVRGFQGDDLSATDTVLATVKHFAAYGAAQAGRDYHSTDMSERELRETYLPPFRAAIDAGAGSLMTAFNDLNGVPATGNEFLLRKLLRDEWQFDGLVVSDYTSINEMIAHGFARDERHAAELAANAGVDMDMQGAAYLEHLAQAVQDGRVTTEQVDESTRRILNVKNRLGLLDDPYRYSDEDRQASLVMSADHREAARDMARRSMVLLRNENKTLPLAADIKTIAVVGPLADSKTDMLGSWVAAGDRHEQPVSVLQGLKEKLGGDVRIRHARGADTDFAAAPDAKAIANAVKIAQQSDIVVAVIGERWNMSGEAASRADLQLPGNQQELLEALVETGTPVVLVLMNGRPLAITWADQNVDAILEAWYPGTMGGHAIADVLVGDYNPSGKLPITFPRNVGQVPIYYDAKSTGRPFTPDKADEKFVSRYLATPNRPLYPFGYGLSYTTFAYSELGLTKNVVSPGETLRAEITVRNVGDYDGEEVVQLYIQDLVASVTRPVRELKAFTKIQLARGEARIVHFDIAESDLSFYRQDMSYGAEAGKFRLSIGGSSEAANSAEFRLLCTPPLEEEGFICRTQMSPQCE